MASTVELDGQKPWGFSSLGIDKKRVLGRTRNTLH